MGAHLLILLVSKATSQHALNDSLQARVDGSLSWRGACWKSLCSLAQLKVLVQRTSCSNKHDGDMNQLDSRNMVVSCCVCAELSRARLQNIEAQVAFEWMLIAVWGFAAESGIKRI